VTRSIIMLNLGINGDEDTLKEARKRFENHQKGILIQPDLRLAVNKKISNTNATVHRL
jgi:hypothetical protein